ncbi:hypothetical protein CHS0354_021760 [Potamilus streckersoni]|uniref:Chitin-binding type-2 domain-containing protein n=1 Tax=Potamilus streckersoni TaxID=2493646 RepID=A0AAE0WE90_9BIVA|nr:hypothetical protein CHS0354_021760 [Potamilus streckersoni]
MTDPLYFTAQRIRISLSIYLHTSNAGTCVPVNKGNCSGNYVDPCDCRKYYQCNNNQYTLIPQNCSESLAFDDRFGNCDFINNVLFNKRCNFTAPWTRCRVDEQRVQELQLFCTNISNTLNMTSTTQRAAVQIQTSKNEDNTGLIVGLVIALIILMILAVAFGVFWLHRRRKQRAREGKSNLPQMENPQYFAKADDDYQQINDLMHDPTYNAGSTMRPSLPARPDDRTANGTLQTENTHGNDFVYDNSAFRDETAKAQTLECATENIGNPGSYMTLENVNNIAQGYDQIGAIGNVTYSSENTMIGEAYVNTLNIANEEGLTQSMKEGV